MPFCKQKILRGIFSPQDLVFPSNYYFELAPNAPVNAASIAFKTFITTSITFIVCSFMCFCSLRFSVIRHALCGRARIQGVVVRSGIGIYLTASASRTGFLRFVRTAKLYVLVGQGKCRAHSRAFHKAYHYVRNIGFFEIALVLRSFRPDGYVERPKVSESYALAVLKRENDLFLKRREHGFHVMDCYGTLAAYVCCHLLQVHVCTVLCRGIKLHCAVFGAFAFDYVVVNHGNFGFG